MQYWVKLDRDILVLFVTLFTELWSTLFYNWWRRREIELAYSFDAFEDENIREIRDRYLGETQIDQGTLKISKKVKKNDFKQFSVRSFRLIFFSSHHLFSSSEVCLLSICTSLSDV
jgi:hypothetical protein